MHGDSPVPAQATVDTFVAPDFWAELTETVAGLRSVLDDPEVDVPADDADSGSPVSFATGDSHSSSSHSGSQAPASADSHAILFGVHTTSEPNEPTLRMKEYLLGVYKARVDAIFKVLHWPSTLSALRDVSLADPSKQALASAIYFTAVCSLMNHELDGRNAIVEQYRRSAEEAFVRANLLSTRDFVTLQAFVIYLVSSALHSHVVKATWLRPGASVNDQQS